MFASASILGRWPVRRPCTLAARWAVCLNGEKKYSEAMEKCRRAVALDKKYWRAWWIWGQSYEAQGNYRAALQIYKKALAANPGSSYLRNLVDVIAWRAS